MGNKVTGYGHFKNLGSESHPASDSLRDFPQSLLRSLNLTSIICQTVDVQAPKTMEVTTVIISN